MKKVLVFVAAVSFFGLSACVSFGAKAPQRVTPVTASDAAHNSRNSVNWDGVYRGVLPGANSDINAEITLGADETFTISYQYSDKSNEVYTGSGTFKWNAAGSIITLDFGNKDRNAPSPFPPQYQVGENILFQLDRDGKRITGALQDKYVLKKVLE